jgi:hypothetical protein
MGEGGGGELHRIPEFASEKIVIFLADGCEPKPKPTFIKAGRKSNNNNSSGGRKRKIGPPTHPLKIRQKGKRNQNQQQTIETSIFSFGGGGDNV